MVKMSIGAGIDSQTGRIRRPVPGNRPSMTLPEVVTAPFLPGNARIGVAVTADTGVWSGVPVPELTLRWQLDGTDIPGATGADYTPVDGDDLGNLRCVVTASNASGSVKAATAVLQVMHVAPVAALALADRSLVQGSGPVSVAAAGDFTGRALEFSVSGGGATIDPDSGVVSLPADTLRTGEVVTVSARNSGGQAESSFQVTVVADEALPEVVTAPFLPGSARIGVAVTADTGVWSGVPVPELTLRWQLDGTDIPGATGADYTPVDGDDLGNLRCVVTASNASGSVKAATAVLQVMHVAPVAALALADRSLVQGSGPVSVAAAGDFTGRALEFSVSGGGATIDPDSGVVSLPADTLRTGEVVTVSARNSGGQAESSFQVTVVADEEPEDEVSGQEHVVTVTSAPEVSAAYAEAFAGTGAFAAAEAGDTRTIDADVSGDLGPLLLQASGAGLAGTVQVKGRGKDVTRFVGNAHSLDGADSGEAVSVLLDDLTVTQGDTGTERPDDLVLVGARLLGYSGRFNDVSFGAGFHIQGSTTHDWTDPAALLAYYDVSGVSGTFEEGEIVSWNGGAEGVRIISVTGTGTGRMRLHVSSRDNEEFNGVRFHMMVDNATGILTGETSRATGSMENTGDIRPVADAPSLTDTQASFWCRRMFFRGEASRGGEGFRCAADELVEITGARFHDFISDPIKLKGIDGQYPLVFRMNHCLLYDWFSSKDKYKSPHADAVQAVAFPGDGRQCRFEIDSNAMWVGRGTYNGAADVQFQGFRLTTAGAARFDASPGSWVTHNFIDDNGQGNPVTVYQTNGLDIAANTFVATGLGVSPTSTTTTTKIDATPDGVVVRDNIAGKMTTATAAGATASGNVFIGSPLGDGDDYPSTFPDWGVGQRDTLAEVIGAYTPAAGITAGCVNQNGELVDRDGNVWWDTNGPVSDDDDQPNSDVTVQAVTIDDLPFDGYVFDCNRSSTNCNAYFSGTATADATIYVRGYNANGSTSWQTVTVDAQGDWSTALAVPASEWGPWYRIEASSVAREVGGVRETSSNRFGLGHVVMIMGQSENARLVHANAEPGTWTIPTLRAALNDENCVTVVDENDDGTISEYFVSQSLLDGTTYISRAMGVLSNFLFHNASDRKFMIVDGSVPGTSRGQLETDANSGAQNNRSFLDFEAIVARVREGGSDIGLVVECWYNSDAARLKNFSDEFADFYTGINISDGSTATSSDGNYLWDLSGGGRGLFDKDATKWAAVRPMPFCTYSGTPIDHLNSTTLSNGGAAWRSRQIEDGRAGVDAFVTNGYIAQIRAGAGLYSSNHNSAFDGSHQLTTTKNGVGLYAQNYGLAICQALGIVAHADPYFSGTETAPDGGWADLIITKPAAGRLSTIAAEENLSDPSTLPAYWQDVMGIEILRSGDGADDQRPAYRSGQGTANHRATVVIHDDGDGATTARIRITPEVAFADGDRLQPLRGGGTAVYNQPVEADYYPNGRMPVVVMDDLKDVTASYPYPGMPVIPPSDPAGFMLIPGSGITLSAPVNTAVPAISGAARTGETLTVTTGTWAGNPAPALSGEWYHDNTATGVTASGYTPASQGEVFWHETATNSAGQGTANSNILEITESAAATAFLPSAQALRDPAGLGAGVADLSIECRFRKHALPDGNTTHFLMHQSGTRLNIGVNRSGLLRLMALKDSVGESILPAVTFSDTGISTGAGADNWHTVKASLHLAPSGAFVRMWLDGTLVYDQVPESGTGVHELDGSRYLVLFGDTGPTDADTFGDADIGYARIWKESAGDGDFSDFGTPHVEIDDQDGLDGNAGWALLP